MVLMELIDLIKRRADPCAGKASFAGRRQKRTAEKLFRRCGLTWGANGRKWGLGGACT